MKLAALHPRQILRALDQIDAAAPSWQMSRPEALRRVFIVLATVSVSLLILHYGKFATNLHALLQSLGERRGVDYLQQLRDAGWLELCSYVWWTGCHLLTFIVLPWLVIRFIFRAQMRDFGWRWNQVGEHWRGYLLLLSPILVFVVLVSMGEDFVGHYPFYRHAGRSWLDFLLWELLYMSQFIFLEFFFRGFMLNALRPAIGANAIWVMCVPYLMIHFPKLWLEATGAILFGLFLGILALQSRSIWGGVLVHAGVALSMDIAALIRKGEFPGSFFPF
ncbi:CPBP family intramembrane glutamic endopeptidase [Cellvibrio mixtus]|uniref:CPBP family intramembrane glutamic endopeptidase n=1 Tax=Cellvibrio mixtus TaxID=39650 RepID=UPI000586ADBC|nr:CPBP family intramembrane glutamic endopeptidase [Cellvibrio mixtus]